jgi:hypothetical protein
LLTEDALAVVDVLTEELLAELLADTAREAAHILGVGSAGVRHDAEAGAGAANA